MGRNVREQLAAEPAKFYPSLSPAIREIAQLLATGKASAAELAKSADQDTLLGTRVLAILESPLYARAFPDRSQISLQIGALRLDGAAFLALAQSVAILGAFEAREFPLGYSSQGFWMHSLGVAMAAESLIPYIKVSSAGLNASSAFVAGLSHDLGKAVLAINFPNEFRDLLELVEQNSLWMFEGEKLLFNIGHDEISANLLEYWGLSDLLIAATRWHHKPAECPTASARPLAYVVQLADFITNHLNFGDSGSRKELELPRKAFEELKIDENAIPEIVATVRAKTKDAQSFIRLCSSQSY